MSGDVSIWWAALPIVAVWLFLLCSLLRRYERLICSLGQAGWVSGYQVTDILSL